jgi:hypothetical protein
VGKQEEWEYRARAAGGSIKPWAQAPGKLQKRGAEPAKRAAE